MIRPPPRPLRSSA